MSLINPALLGWLLLAGVPVLLHFLLKSKPKKLLFPALRLLAQRRKHNSRRMRIKHLWLLLLRMAVVALFVLALARPKLPAARYGFVWSEWLALAAVAAVGVGVYFGVLYFWRRQNLAHHEMAYRRTMLRGGTGVGVFLLTLLLVLWPYARRVGAEMTSPLPATASEIPVAAVLLFDTSTSMAYQQEGATRLEKAVELGMAQLERFPRASKVAVTDTGDDDAVIFQADRGSAARQLQDREVLPGAATLDDRLLAALRLQRADIERTEAEQSGDDVYLREIYVFTDLTRSAWRTGSTDQLRRLLNELESVRVYVVDVGVEEPIDFAVSDLRLSKHTLGRGAELYVHGTVTSAAPAETAPVVEVHVQNELGQMVKQGQRAVDFSDKTEDTVQFLVRGLNAPVAHGYLKLVSSDPLVEDDVRYFSVRVVEPPRVLLVGPTRVDTVYLQAALAPPELVDENRSQYLTDFADYRDFGRIDLEKYESVALVNVPSLPESSWSKLHSFVEQGGGMFLALGSFDVNTDAGYVSESAEKLLPGKVEAWRRFGEPAVLDLTNLEHPLLESFDDFGTDLISDVDVYLSWVVDPHPEASVITTFTDTRRTPALLERAVGRGRVVMLTTAVDLPPQDARRNTWSHLVYARWQFLVFADQLFRFLGQRGSDVYGVEAGDPVLLPLPDPHPAEYVLRMPGFEQRPGKIAPDADRLVIADVVNPGHYDVESADDALPLDLGFSVNVRSAETRLQRLEKSDLDQLLGEDRYALARDLGTLEREVGRGRPTEVFGMLLAIVIAAFAGEHLVANRFYEGDQAEAAAA